MFSVHGETVTTRRTRRRPVADCFIKPKFHSNFISPTLQQSTRILSLTQIMEVRGLCHRLSESCASRRTLIVVFSSLRQDSNKRQLRQYTGWAMKKRGTLLLSISLPIIGRFSKFFHWRTLQTICDNAIIIDPNTP